MTPGTIMILILILMLVGAFPIWPYSRNWGFGPACVAGVMLAALLILTLADRASM